MDKIQAQSEHEEDIDLRRGPWTVDEDLILINYISTHGEGRWNSLARCAGLKRTGKSCRLRWLNYLRPDVRRGNITPEEQLLILELHSRWGNRWSKIAQHLPGRTDNEIKNYWRTRVQKHAKQLKCDVNSKQFKDVMRYLWMPRLLEKIRAASNGSGSTSLYANSVPQAGRAVTAAVGGGYGQVLEQSPEYSYDSSSVTVTAGENKGCDMVPVSQYDECWWNNGALVSPGGYGHQLGLVDQFETFNIYGDLNENLWSLEDNWIMQ